MSNRGRPVKYETADEMQDLIDEYFKQMKKQKRPYTVTGLALSLGMTRKGLIEYEQKNDDFGNTIRMAKSMVEQYIEERAYMGKINPAIGIFSLKNFGWSDKQEVEQSGGTDNKLTINFKIPRPKEE